MAYVGRYLRSNFYADKQLDTDSADAIRECIEGMEIEVISPAMRELIEFEMADLAPRIRKAKTN